MNRYNNPRTFRGLSKISDRFLSDDARDSIDDQINDLEYIVKQADRREAYLKRVDNNKAIDLLKAAMLWSQDSRARRATDLIIHAVHGIDLQKSNAQDCRVSKAAIEIMVENVRERARFAEKQSRALRAALNG